jgi:hypothetical protein
MAEALKETGIPDAPAGEPARSEEELQVETASIFSDSRRELDFLYEHGLGPGRGAINIANELINFFDFAGRTVGSAAEKISGSAVGRAALKVHPLTEQLARPGVQQFLQRTDEPLQVPRFLGESKTFMGGMNETLSQFALGLYLTSWMRLAGPATAVAGKAASLVGRVGPRKAIARLGKFNEFSLRGAIVDGALFDPWEDTLGEIAHELGPDFLNPLTQYLASEPGDSESERRFVNALEGLLLGGAVEGLFVASARAIRGARWLKRKVRGATAGRAEKEIIASFEEIEAAAGGQQPKVKEGDVAVARVDADNSTVLEVVDPEAARRLQETGFAGVEGPAVVNVPQGQRIGPGGAEETPKVIQRAQESVGPEEFQARAEAEAANRGVDLNDPAQAGAGSAVVEDTARKIVAESQPDVPSVRFNSRGDANAQAATFNETMQNHALPVRELTEEQETLVKQVADELKEARRREGPHSRDVRSARQPVPEPPDREARIRGHHSARDGHDGRGEHPGGSPHGYPSHVPGDREPRRSDAADPDVVCTHGEAGSEVLACSRHEPERPGCARGVWAQHDLPLQHGRGSDRHVSQHRP